MPPKRKFGGGSSSGKGADALGTWKLSSNRQISISMFTGDPRIDIRETYEKDGASLPGKKGISLAIDQWKAVLKAATEIEKILRERGDWDDEEEEEEEEPEEKPAKKSKKTKKVESEEDDDNEEEEVTVKKKVTKKKGKKARDYSDDED